MRHVVFREHNGRKIAIKICRRAIELTRGKTRRRNVEKRRTLYVRAAKVRSPEGRTIKNRASKILIGEIPTRQIVLS